MLLKPVKESLSEYALNVNKPLLMPIPFAVDNEFKFDEPKIVGKLKAFVAPIVNIPAKYTEF